MSSDSSDREEALCSDREEEQKRNRAREKKKRQREQQRERKSAPPPRLLSSFFARPVATPSAAATPAAATPAATTPAPLTAASPLTEPTDANVADAPDGVTNAASSMQSGDVATTTSPEPASLHCTICLDTLQASALGNRACVTLPCTHTFHAECVLTFAMSDCRNHGRCPNCRGRGACSTSAADDAMLRPSTHVSRSRYSPVGWFLVVSPSKNACVRWGLV